MRRDAAALDELLMDDFIYTSARGEVLHKPQYLQNLASGEVQMEGEKYSQLEVRQHENKVWIRHQGRWRALALHACLPPN